MCFRRDGTKSKLHTVRAIRTSLLMLLLCLSLTQRGTAEFTVYSADKDVRQMAQLNMVNFGGVGMYATMSSGEILLRRILRKEEALKHLMEVYNTGTPAAKVYALAYFHHSAPELFQICWGDIVGKYNPVVRSTAGCLTMEGSLLEHMIRIREGQYDPFVERAVIQAERSLRK